MSPLNKTLNWSLPLAAAAAAPLALLPERATSAILDALDWVGDDRIASLLAVTNALTLVP